MRTSVQMLAAMAISSKTMASLKRCPCESPRKFPFSPVLSPEIAALSMSGSTLIVAINALMLKRTKLAGIRQPGKSVTPAAAETPRADANAAA